MPKQNPAMIADYGTYLGAEAAYNLQKVEQYAIEYGLKSDYLKSNTLGGYILQPFLDAITNVAKPATEEVFDTAQKKLADLGDAFIDAAGLIDATEKSNTDLISQFNLDGTGPPGDSNGEDAYREGAAFPIADLVLDPPPPSADGEDDLDLKGTAAKIETVVNWVMSTTNELAPKIGIQSPFNDGDTFEKKLIDPILGDFGAINCYGQAWQTVFTGGFAPSIARMGENLTTLVGADAHDDNGRSYWTGSDAAAAKMFFDQNWAGLVQPAAERVGTSIAQGFQKISEALSNLASTLVNEVGKLLDFIGNFVTRYMKNSAVGGAVQAGAEYLTEFVWNIKGDAERAAHNTTLTERIKGVVETIQNIWNAIESMRQMVETANEYLGLIRDLNEALKGFSDIHDIQSAGAFAKEVGAAGDRNVAGRDKFVALQDRGSRIEDLGAKLNDSETALDNVNEKYREQDPNPADNYLEDWEQLPESVTGPDGEAQAAYRHKETGIIRYLSPDLNNAEKQNALSVMTPPS